MKQESGLLKLGVFELHGNRLVVNGHPSFSSWQECGATLRQMEGAVQFWIGDWLNWGEHAYGEKYAQAVNETEAETWRVYAHVSDRVLIRINNLSWTHHREVAKFGDDPALQRELLDRAGGLSVSEFKSLIRSYLHGKKLTAIATGVLPSSEYDVICADPPWQYDNSGFDQSAAAHYPVMDVDAICSLPERDSTFPKFADPSVLFLWATSPLLPAATTVMASWGFDYKACLVWVKDKAPALGWWVKTRHELLLVGARGSSTPLEKVDSVITAAVAEHSRKPTEAYEAIDRMFPPGLRRVECFARTQRDGWDVWGNEV